MSALSPLFPFDIEQLQISFFEFDDYASLKITDPKLYKQVSPDYIKHNIWDCQDDDTIIYFIDNNLVDLTVPTSDKVVSDFIELLIKQNLLAVIKHLIHKELIFVTAAMVNNCIYLASMCGSLDIVKHFCSLISADSTIKYSSNALKIAVIYERMEIIKYLCSLDYVDPSRDDNSAFYETLGSDTLVAFASNESVLLEIAIFLCSFDSVRSKITNDNLFLALEGYYPTIGKYLLSLLTLEELKEDGHWMSYAIDNNKSEMIEYLQSIGYEDRGGTDDSAEMSLSSSEVVSG